MTDKAHAIGTIAAGTALFTLAAVLGSPALAATFVAGISTNLFSNLFEIGLRRGAKHLRRGSATVNGHLHTALWQAFLDAVETLHAGWPAYAEGRGLTDLVEESEALFEELRRDLDELFTEDLIDDILGDATALRAFQTGEGSAHAAFNATIKEYLESSSPELIEYVQGHLVEHVKACLIVQLKIDDEEHNPAWRAFQMLMLNSLVDELTSLRGGQNQDTARLMAVLMEIRERLTVLEAEQRDPWGGIALDVVWNDLRAAIRSESRRTRRVVKETGRLQADRVIKEIQIGNASLLENLIAEIRTTHGNAEANTLLRELLARLANELRKDRAAIVVALAPLVNTNPEIYQSVMGCVTDGDQGVQRAAMEALAPLAADDPDVRRDLLSHLDPIKKTLLALADGDKSTQVGAVQALAPLAAGNAEVRTALLARLGDSEISVHLAAVEALGPLAAGDAEVRTALLALIARLGDNYIQVQEEWSEALGPQECGYDTADLEIRLRRLSDGYSQVRVVAVGALAPLAAGDAEVRTALLTLCWDTDIRVRVVAVRALAPLAAGDPKVRAALLARLTDHNWEIRQVAVEALAPLAADDAEVRTALVVRLTDSRWEVLISSVKSLVPLAADDAEVRTALLARFTDRNEDGWRLKKKVLVRLAADAPDVRTMLRVLLTDGDGVSTYVAAAAMAALAASDPEARTALTTLLTNDNDLYHQVAAEALIPYAADDPAIRAALLARLTARNRYIGGYAVEALAPLAASDPKVRAAMIAILTPPSDTYFSGGKREAVEALAPLAASDPKVRAALLARFTDSSWAVQQAAVEALAPLAASDPKVRAALLACLTDHDWERRQAAVEGLPPLAANDPEVRAALLAHLTHVSHFLGVEGLSPLVFSIDPDFLAWLLAKHTRVGFFSKSDDVAIARGLVRVLAPFAANDPAVRAALLARLTHSNSAVRLAAAEALAPLVANDAEVRAALLARLTDSSPRVCIEISRIFYDLDRV